MFRRRCRCCSRCKMIRTYACACATRWRTSANLRTRRSARRSSGRQRSRRGGPQNENATGRREPTRGVLTLLRCSEAERRLDIVVEIKLVRRRAHADRVQLLRALEVEPLVDRVLREHVAAEKE